MDQASISQRAKRILQAVPCLTENQQCFVARVVESFFTLHTFILNNDSWFNQSIVANFGDLLLIHHALSLDPFSKDKFEFGLLQMLRLEGHQADLASRGNPGYDILIDSQRVSLKTQANRGVNPNEIWISKFMEMGKGEWGDDPADLIGLRDRFIAHMQHYDRILTLRTLHTGNPWLYELVEIPKLLLEQSITGELKMMTDSTQRGSKPGYCYVRDAQGVMMYQLYFDGGSERKLQIKSLRKDLCIVHATWEFISPEYQLPKTQR